MESKGRGEGKRTRERERGRKGSKKVKRGEKFREEKGRYERGK